MPVSISVKYKRDRPPRGMEPLTPQRKWRAITLATLVLVPAFWSMLAGFVAAASDEEVGGPAPGPAIALGLALIPFVFIVLAFMSEHPRAPAAVVKAMALTLLVGIPVAAVAGDAVTGLVAGVGAGGIVALRADDEPLAVPRRRTRRRRVLHVRARTVGGRDHAALGADLPVHEHRDRRPLHRAPARAGSRACA